MPRPRLPHPYAWTQLSLRGLSTGFELVALVMLIGLSAAHHHNFPVSYVAVFWGLGLDFSEIAALARPRFRRIPASWMFPAELISLALFSAGFCSIIISYYNKPQDIFTGAIWPSQVQIKHSVEQWRMGAFALQVAAATLSLVYMMMSCVSWCTYGKW